MDFLFKYIWFIFGLFAAFGLLFLPFRISRLAAQYPTEKEDIRKTLLITSIYYLVPYFVLGIIQLLGGFDTAFYIFFVPLTNTFALAAVAFMVIYYMIAICWVLLGGGAAKVVRYRMVRGIGANNETFVKFFVVFMFLVGVVVITAPRFLLIPFMK